jgi:alpha-L-fucosidase
LTNEVDVKSSVYRSAVALPEGGTVQSAVVEDGRLGIIASRYFAGLVPTGWKVVTLGGNPQTKLADAAIDGNVATNWIGCSHAGTASTCSITVDMGSAHDLRGFTYLPPSGGDTDGIVELYRFETSEDGRSRVVNIDKGRFGNIRNNPVRQESTFTPVKARFFRFTALETLGGQAA